ncbi:MAG: hypothetical protein ACTSYD_08360 [Candidatus Heimdallarchaeaceae archaeon]
MVYYTLEIICIVIIMLPYARPDVPPDKFMEQLLLQAIQAFYIQDYDTGVYFLNQIRTNLPRYLYQISPALKRLFKDIVKIIQEGGLVPQRPPTNVTQSPSHAEKPDLSPSVGPQATPTDFISELSSAVASRKEKKKKKVAEELTGSIDDLVDIDI